MHQEKKIAYGKFFDFRAQKCIQNLIPRDQNPGPGSWTHLGAFRGFRSQKLGPFGAIH